MPTLSQRLPPLCARCLLACGLVLCSGASWTGCASRVPAGSTSTAWTRPQYIAVDALDPDPAVARARQDWYARTLAALSEPSFIELSRRPGQAVRFLWLRHWHAPVAVMVSRVGDQAVAEVRQLSGLARRESTPGSLVGVRRVVLSAQDWRGVQRRLDAVKFWQLPTSDPFTDGGPEGARWVFEAVDDGRLQVVDRFSPDDPAMVDLGLYLLALAGVEVPEREVY